MIFRFLFFVVVAYLLYRLTKGLLGTASRKKPQVSHSLDGRIIQGGDLVQDPYCKTYIPEKDAYKGTLNGVTLNFCSEACFKKYERIQKKES
ncbi:MAG: hypothetical protein A4E70_00007 [Syntrophus sp. PtaU1.Bin005]|jgi:YHS domain-containing protein|nr:MAG: hypothetical protein A4E69_03140 [Syntrophus sp. PtaB.Bin138]OPY83755.1 MAG: hypothetical protein A4E70_00007 [Syntrophus sp. PtaU1.Bin005]